MNIRTATFNDLEQISEVELSVFLLLKQQPKKNLLIDSIITVIISG